MGGTIAVQTNPLPSWNEGEATRSIVTFAQAVTARNGPDYVPPAARIAVFDNDGTLWSEQPLYIQLAFAMDRAQRNAAPGPSTMVAEGDERDPC
jgi:hypothetical protein